VRTPSRMVVLENLPPQRVGSVEVKTANIQYLGNSADYIRNIKLPEIPDDVYKKTPTSLLGARVAVNLAAYAGAQQYAQNEFKDAQDKLQEAENAWRLKESEAGIDATARTATSLAVRAEDTAMARKASEERREETARRDADIKKAETAAANAGKESNDLRGELDRERRARELSERDVANLNRQVVDLRTEVSRLREELDQSQSEGEKAKIELARIEGERGAEQRRIELKQTLARFGNVKETERGASIILSESIWAGTRSAQLKPSASATLEPLAALLANNPEYRVTIDSYTDSTGSPATLLQLTQERAQAIATKFSSAGIDNSRIQANGMGTANSIASNKTAAGKARNRRVEITLTPSGGQSTSSTTSSTSN
ncbi:MAG: OmpA family protein, partial [Pyrinomonadaceae bacterium]